MIAEKKDNLVRIEDKLGNVPFYIARFYEEIKKTTPHKHENYYELVYLMEGEGFHWIEEREYMISTPEFYFLLPWQLHHWQFASTPRGYVILFKKSYFNDVYDRQILKLIFQLTGRVRIGIPPDYSPDPLLQNILDEYSCNSEFSIQIIHGLLIALLAKILQLLNVQTGKQNVPGTLYEKYQELIFTECLRFHRVKDFAKLLNTTPQNLNALCRRQTGKSAKDLIHYQLILEAKRYLLYTEYTLSEISQLLPFNDTSYFIKFFKKQVGISPLEFRKKYFQ